MLAVTTSVPFIALGAAGIIAVMLFGLWIRKSIARGRWSATALARAAIPASLAATAIPVVISTTRSDVCHIGFIEGGCVLAVLGLFAIRPPGRTLRRLVSTTRGVLSAGLVVSFLMAAVFYVHSLRAKPAGFIDLDVEGKVAYGGDVIAARTQATDRLLVTRYGGWSYLYSRRDNATSYAFLIDDPYCEEQWPIAARQIVERRPLLLLVADADFTKLKTLQPSIGTMYFGFSGNYMLDERGAGPPLDAPAVWDFVMADADGHPGRGDRIIFTIRTDGGSARLLAGVEGCGYDVRASIHHDRVSIFDGGVTYVGVLAQQGGHIDGTRFGPGAERRSFVARKR